jgi:hypothetical protein
MDEKDIMLFQTPAKGVIANYMQEDQKLTKKTVKDYLRDELEILRFTPSKRDFWDLVEKGLDRFLVCGCSNDDQDLFQRDTHGTRHADTSLSYDTSFRSQEDYDMGDWQFASDFSIARTTPTTDCRRTMKKKQLGKLPPSVYVLAAAYDSQVRSKKVADPRVPSPTSVSQF